MGCTSQLLQEDVAQSSWCWRVAVSLGSPFSLSPEWRGAWFQAATLGPDGPTVERVTSAVFCVTLGKSLICTTSTVTGLFGDVLRICAYSTEQGAWHIVGA